MNNIVRFLKMILLLYFYFNTVYLSNTRSQFISRKKQLQIFFLDLFLET